MNQQTAPDSWVAVLTPWAPTFPSVKWATLFPVKWGWVREMLGMCPKNGQEVPLRKQQTQKPLTSHWACWTQDTVLHIVASVQYLSRQQQHTANWVRLVRGWTPSPHPVFPHQGASYRDTDRATHGHLMGPSGKTYTHRLTHTHMHTYIHISTHARLVNRGGCPQGSSPLAKPTCPLSSGLFPPAYSGKDSKMTVVTLSLKGLESHVVICIKVQTQKYLCKLSNNHSHMP